jgi:hypothetical protein
MISITTQQKDFLEQNGCTWGEDLHRTHSKYKKYFATESAKVKSLLKMYESDIRSKKIK